MFCLLMGKLEQEGCYYSLEELLYCVYTKLKMGSRDSFILHTKLFMDCCILWDAMLKSVTKGKKVLPDNVGLKQKWRQHGHVVSLRKQKLLMDYGGCDCWAEHTAVVLTLCTDDSHL